MTISKFLKTASVLALFAVSTQSCVQDNEWDIPPIACENKFNAATITLADFVKKAPLFGTYTIPADSAEVIVEGYVVSSDEHGNFYNTISIQDKPENPTVGLQIETRKVNNYSDMPVGAKIRIRANGLVLGTDRGVKKLGSVDPSYAIGRIPDIQFRNYVSGVCENGKMVVEPIVPLQLPSLSAAQDVKYINMLVSVPNVQFANSEVGKTFVELNPATDTDRVIEDITGGTSVLRNSGYSTFGATKIPEGNGTLTFVVSRYNTSWQMLIRSLDDVQFTGNRVLIRLLGGSNLEYKTSFTENFTSYDLANLNNPTYYNYAVEGNRHWAVKSFQSNKYLELSAYLATSNVITYFGIPAEFTGSSKLSFKTKDGFNNGDVLKVYYSTSYTPGSFVDPSKFVDITGKFTIAKGSTATYASSFTDSGEYTIPATGKGFIFFEYKGKGSRTLTTTMQLDDIKLQ
ncbi:DUF5689 domain-containing protein [Bergeyella porcorum]|uniref:DUF5689 domain-containing protein n=1 Tax=Bergeyella porcorum TaxID=1735111 RepID=UPI0035E57185